MKYLRFLPGVLAAIALCAPADEIAGTWETQMDLSRSGIPQVAYDPIFEFQVQGNELSGLARLQSWPGTAPISDGRIDGNHIAFTLLHQMSYTTRGRTCYPKFRVEGTVHGDELDLTLFHAPFDCSGIASMKWEMKGRRIRARQ